jgi:hypothetical protein
MYTTTATSVGARVSRSIKSKHYFVGDKNGVAWRENVVCFLVEENDAKTIFSSVLATWCLQMVVVCCLWVYTGFFFLVLQFLYT